MAVNIPWKMVNNVLVPDIPKFEGYDRIVGLTRGGVILASLIHRFYPKSSLCLHNPSCLLFVGDDSVLVVDDIFDTGTTIKNVWDQSFIREGNLQMYTLVSKQLNVPEYLSYGIFLDTPEWIHFPWEIEETT